MANQTKNLWATDADDSSLQSKSGGSFGLNTGNVTLFEYTDKAGKDNSEGHAVDIHVLEGTKEFKRRLYFNVGGEVYGAKNTRLKPGDEGYDDAFGADLVQKIAVIKQTLEAVGVTKQQIATVAAALDPSFEATVENVKKIMSLVPTGYNSKPVDAFLEYQWNISEGQNRTFLEFPSNCKGGRIITASVTPVGKWTKVVSEESGLSYVDDAGNVHPFTRSASYMESNRAIQQGEGSEDKSSANTPPPAQTAKQSTW